MPRHPLRDATPFALESDLVESCIDPDNPIDAVFREAFRRSLASVPRERASGGLAGITGHVAESVIEIVLHELGYAPVWHFRGPGGHGIDLAMLSPAMDRVLVLEIKVVLRGPARLEGEEADVRSVARPWAVDGGDEAGGCPAALDRPLHARAGR